MIALYVILGILLWIASGLLGSQLANRALNKLYPEVAESMRLDEYLMAIGAPINLLAALCAVWAWRRR